MSKSNGAVLLPFVILSLLSTCLFSPNSMVYGSSLQQQQQQRSFNRPDPLRHFKSYNGTYDIRNKHYWASAAFTGVYGYAIAGIWILCGMGFGIFLMIKNPSNGSSSAFIHSESCYLIMFMLVLLFTFLALVASSFVLAANQSSLKRTRKLKETIVQVGRNATHTIKKITGTLTKMQNLLLPYDQAISNKLNWTNHQLLKESRSIRNFVQKNGHSIDLAAQTSYIAHLAVVSINLVLLVAGLVLLLLHWHSGFIIIIFICWILTTLCWVLTGLDCFLHTFAEDTCSAFRDYNQNPNNNSLSSILPCTDPSYSNKTMVEIGSTVHNFITWLNSKITGLIKSLELDEESEAMLGVWKICNPFSGAPNYSYIPENCPKDTIPIGDLPNVLASFTCYNENATNSCKGNGKFVPEAYYVMARSYSGSVQDLIEIIPDLESLTQCSFVKDAFSDFVWHQCRPFRASLRLLWSSMLSLSIFMAGLVLSWVAKAYQDRGKCFSTCSIFPKDPNPV